MKTKDYIELIKQEKNLPSNYAVARHFGLSPSTLTNYSKGNTCFSDEIALKVASELGLNAGIVLADMHAEREKNPDLQGAWAQVARSLQQATAAAFVCVMLSIPTPSAEASTLNGLNFSTLHSIYYANLKKYLKKCLFRLFYFENWGKCAGFLCV